jgi:methyl-accepting chemotaxis protein
MNIKLKYTLFGVAFGAFFPIGATVFEILIHELPFSVNSIKQIHNQNPLLYIIDSAPFWLGIFAFFGGIQQAKSNKLLNQFEQISKNLSKSSDKLNTDSKNTFSVMKKELDNLMDASINMKSINETINNNISSCNTYSTELSDSSNNMIDVINNLYIYNEKANKGNTEITSDFLNFLALNSGIEASKIGVKGRGFSVIAKNIKDLAESTFEISNSIENLLKESKSSIKLIKNKINIEHENLNTLDKTTKLLKDDLNTFKNAIDQISLAIGTTYNKNDEQNTLFNELKSAIEYLETAYNGMQSALSQTITEETKIVDRIKLLKHSE